MFVGGIRALLLQSLHPVAMAGVAGTPVSAATRGDGCTARATSWPSRRTRRSRTPSGHQRGPGPRAGRGGTRRRAPYRADDPDLLAWVHLAEVDSFLAAYDPFGATPLTATERDQYVAQAGIPARRLGVRHPPTTHAELADRAGWLPTGAPDDRPRRARRRELLLRHPPLSPGSSRLGLSLDGGGRDLHPARPGRGSMLGAADASRSPTG